MAQFSTFLQKWLPNAWLAVRRAPLCVAQARRITFATSLPGEDISVTSTPCCAMRLPTFWCRWTRRVPFIPKQLHRLGDTTLILDAGVVELHHQGAANLHSSSKRSPKPLSDRRQFLGSCVALAAHLQLTGRVFQP